MSALEYIDKKTVKVTYEDGTEKIFENIKQNKDRLIGTVQSGYSICDKAFKDYKEFKWDSYLECWNDSLFTFYAVGDLPYYNFNDYSFYSEEYINDIIKKINEIKKQALTEIINDTRIDYLSMLERCKYLFKKWLKEEKGQFNHNVFREFFKKREDK